MIARTYISEITPYIGKEKIIILKWARQVGKTTLMKELQRDISNKDQRAKTVFLYADKIDTQHIFASPENFIHYLKYTHNFPNDFLYIFIDEFQFIQDAGIFLKNIFDEYKQNLQIIASGSSSLEITKNTEYLTGRSINFYIDRISFWEYFSYTHDISLPHLTLENFHEIQEFYTVFGQKLERDLISYMSYWGYPEVVTRDDIKVKETILSQIVQTYIEKDIIHLLHIENITAFNNLIKILASNIGNLLNIHELSNTLNISMPTLSKYMDILEWTFVFSKVPPYFQNVRKELSKMPKIYVEDLGIKNYSLWELWAISKKIDLWAEIENFIYNELSKKFEKRNIYFYRTVSKAEIDFVVEVSYKNYILFECKYRNKKTRIPVVMKNFENSYGKSPKIIITKDYLDKDEDIFYIPASLFSFVHL